MMNCNSVGCWLSIVDSRRKKSNRRAGSKLFHHADVSDPIKAIALEIDLAMKWNVWILFDLKIEETQGEHKVVLPASLGT